MTHVHGFRTAILSHFFTVCLLVSSALAAVTARQIHPARGNAVALSMRLSAETARHVEVPAIRHAVASKQPREHSALLLCWAHGIPEPSWREEFRLIDSSEAGDSEIGGRPRPPCGSIGFEARVAARERKVC